MRNGLSPPRIHRTLGLMAAAAFLGCSGSGGGPAGPGPVSSQDGGASLTYQGQVFDHMSGAPLAGVRVVAGGRSSTTDQAGRFAISAGEGSELVLLGAGYYDRVTAVEGLSANLSVVPRTFDMAAFNDVARDYAAGTVRWVSSPDVYVDIRPHGFVSGTSVPAAWIEQVVALTPRFLAGWSGGRVVARSVTVGSTPPSPGTVGTLVVSFDEDASRYPSSSAAGVAVASWDASGAIGSATVRLRFSGLSGDAAALSRQAVLGHELGHALGLAHMDGATFSMMAPVIRTPELTTFDLAAGALLYDRRPGTRADDREAGSGVRSALAPSTATAAATCGVEIETAR